MIAKNRNGSTKINKISHDPHNPVRPCQVSKPMPPHTTPTTVHTPQRLMKKGLPPKPNTNADARNTTLARNKRYAQIPSGLGPCRRVGACCGWLDGGGGHTSLESFICLLLGANCDTDNKPHHANYNENHQDGAIKSTFALPRSKSTYSKCNAFHD